MTAIFDHPYLAVAALILGFGFLIFVHELGHFLVAKWVGIRATQFAIGFGQALVSYRKGIGVKVGSTEPQYRRRAAEAIKAKGVNPDGVTEKDFYAAADALGLGETEYRLNWMPLGGYVKMLGQEDMDPNAMSDDPRAFNRKPVWARAAVISAGVVMNIIFGVIFLVIAFSDFAGVQFPAPRVGGTLDGSPAATTFADGHDGDLAYLGLQPGDHVTTVNGKPIDDLVAVKIATALGDPYAPVVLTVRREGLADPLTYKIKPEASARTDGMLSAGIEPAYTLEVAGVAEGSPWAAAGVGPGARLQAIGDRAGQETLNSFADLTRRFDQSGGEPLTLGFTDEKAAGETGLVEITPRPAFAPAADGRVTPLGLIPATAIGSVQPDSPAEQLGIKPGDVLARVGDQNYPPIDAIARIISQASGPVEVGVLRDGQTLDLGAIKPSRGKLGIGLSEALEVPVIAGTESGSALEGRNLPPGSRVTSIDGEPVTGWADLQRAMQRLAARQAGADPVLAAVGLWVNVGEAGLAEEAVVPLAASDLEPWRFARWTPPDGIAFMPDKVRIAGATFGEAASIGFVKTGEFIQQTYITLLRLFQRSVKISNLRGPVGIVDEGSRLAREGWPYYLFFLGLISINLAVINFLPIPIVDGGLMVFLLIEKLRGKPASPAIQTAAMVVGLVFIAGVFVLVTYHDITRIVTG